MYVEKARKRISKRTVVEYTLDCKKSGYSIECVEYGNDGVVKDKSEVNDITTLLCVAKRIFNLIVSNSVTACTLYDVICDLIC